MANNNNKYWNTGAGAPQMGATPYMPQQVAGVQQQYPTGVAGAQQQFPPGAYPSGFPGAASGGYIPGPGGQLPIEQSYIENILRLNRGKVAKVYMTFETKETKVFTGVIEAAGRDHIVLSDPQSERRYLLLMVYLDYITFDEEIEYSYPVGQMTQYTPR
ncbi:spore coat protein GerQ [Pseudalkalibacillus caeni]|uniref:Spore coat protein GerQ n=1 Tax=Exobacillus caeni TaxID=2574798 RepID=A0A5R9F753_9BACL|nr:spore coat protein GerQ [Pseudalkalibacillus caeni]TLS36663.1 spore coat protein GerQ [Pseudalkalibacillus caeni]